MLEDTLESDIARLHETSQTRWYEQDDDCVM